MRVDPSLSVTIAAILEKCITVALKYDPATRSKLSNLNEKAVKIAITEPEIEFYFCIIDNEIEVKVYSDIQADAVISGKALDFFSAIGNSNHSFAESNLCIAGKITLLNQLQEILSDLDIDWEEPLNEFLGVIPGHTIAETVRSSCHWLARQSKDATEAIPEYLCEELRAMPSNSELEHFYESVDQLKSSTTRLAAKIQRLQQRTSIIYERNKN